jgi:elongation factor Tu
MRKIFNAGRADQDSSPFDLAAARTGSPAHAEFEAEVSILHKDQGGRHTPFFSNYQAQFWFDDSGVTGVITLPEGTLMAMPGGQVTVKVRLAEPVPMEVSQYFDISEGGRTIATGQVMRIAE